jgi:hypothetical protein
LDRKQIEFDHLQLKNTSHIKKTELSLGFKVTRKNPSDSCFHGVVHEGRGYFRVALVGELR